MRVARITGTLALLFTLVAGCAGCGSDTTPTSTPTPSVTVPPGTPPPNRPSSPAQISITSPAACVQTHSRAPANRSRSKKFISRSYLCASFS